MNDCEHELFEAELRRLAPARPPAALLERLAATSQPRPARNPQLSSIHNQLSGWRLLRWLVPATAVGAAAAILLVGRSPGPASHRRADLPVAPAQPGLKADDVEFDQQLVASFDAVAQMPDGQPVRFRCREWADAVVLRDSARGIEIEQRTPRLEVVPVRFEIY